MHAKLGLKNVSRVSVSHSVRPGTGDGEEYRVKPLQGGPQ